MISIHRVAIVLAALGSVTTASAPAVAAAPDSRPHTPGPAYMLSRGRYTLFDVPAATVATSAFGITNDGTIVGKYNDGTTSSGPGADEHGFIRSPAGRFTTVDLPGVRATAFFRANDKGQFVGVYSRSFGRVGDDPHRQGFLLDHGRITWITVPGSMFTQPIGINNRGQIVGDYQAANGAPGSFRWERGRFTDITLPGIAIVDALDVNDRGQVAGSYADTVNPAVAYGFLLTKGTYQTITAPGGGITLAAGLNNLGQVAVTGFSATGTRGFLYAQGPRGPATPIQVPGSSGNGANDVNDRGEVTGGYTPS